MEVWGAAARSAAFGGQKRSPGSAIPGYPFISRRGVVAVSAVVAMVAAMAALPSMGSPEMFIVRKPIYGSVIVPTSNLFVHWRTPHSLTFARTHGSSDE